MQTVEKWVTRSDAWTSEDDERLASLVLHHIRTGSTQLRAFEEAANQLGRTAAACGYRWNGVVRKDYRDEIEAAKRDRKTAQKGTTAPVADVVEESTPVPMTSSESMKEVIKFLQTYDEHYQRLRQQVELLESEKDRLTNRLRDLETQVVRTPAPAAAPVTPEQLQEDSKTLFAIMERARKLLESDARARTEL